MDASTDSSAIEAVPVPAVEAVAAPPVPARPRPQPVYEPERLKTLDVIRGIAICGILLVNIEDFAMIRESRYDPNVTGGSSRLDHWVWIGTWLLADTKFIVVFTMLFGAGIAMANERRRARRPRGAWLAHYRRMFFLMAVGAVHAMLLWRGDILFYYATAGLALYFAPRFPALVLAMLGLFLYAVFIQEFASQLMEVPSGYSWWKREFFRATWHEQFHFRIDSEKQVIGTKKDYTWLVLREYWSFMFGLMMFGMALLRNGFLSGRAPIWAYAAFTALMFASGLGLIVHGTGLHPYFTNVTKSKEFVWGSLLLSMGYIGLAIVLVQLFPNASFISTLAALGRMAFTNYIMQTVICTFIFYGYGLGLYERMKRTDQLAIVVGIWALQMLYSRLWLHFFQFGPLEWVWRSFTYWRIQPLRRRRVPAEELPAAV